MLFKIGVPTNYIGKYLRRSLVFKVAGLYSATLLKKAFAQVFFSEFCEVFKNTSLEEHGRLLLVFTKVFTDLIILCQCLESLFDSST